MKFMKRKKDGFLTMKYVETSIEGVRGMDPPPSGVVEIYGDPLLVLLILLDFLGLVRI